MDLFGDLRDDTAIADLDGDIDGNIIRLPENGDSLGQLFAAQDLLTHGASRQTGDPVHIQGGGAGNHFQDFF